MKKGKRLLCLGVVFSLLYTNVAYGVEVIPPNPLSGNPTSSSAAIPGSSEWGPGATPPSESQPPSEGQPAQIPSSGGTAADSSNWSSQALAGTVFSGSAAVAEPVVAAEGAVLLNCGTGQILYGKNAHTQFYPASITKVMTALLTIENCNLQDIVTFSQSATTNLESGAVTLDLTAGDQLTVEQCLYALLLKSANEVANGLAEHISGSVSAFAVKMNERAAQLGCLGTHFANPNGLNNNAHLTTPYDMALIARAAYSNPTLSQISTTTAYQMPATIKGAGKSIAMGHKMVYPTDTRYYPGIVGGKTGYTSRAGNTLVTCVERNGVRLVAVVMKASGTHYTDTKAMLDYGFTLAERGELPTAGATSVPDQTVGPGSIEITTGNAEGPGAVSIAGWNQDQGGWYYIKADGSKAANEWLTIDGKEYWFDSNTYMAVGWRKYVGEIWYYFNPSGELAKNAWVKSDEKWYYVGADGTMLKNTITPDGHILGADGAWIQ